MFSLYHNPDLDDRIFYCLLFPFFYDLNGHHLEWLGSTITNRDGVAAFDFSTVFGCDQLLVGPTHACSETLDLLMTDIPDLVRVAVVAPICNSENSCWQSFRWLRRFHTCVLVGKFF